jgi:hypothetical protein
MLIHSWDRLLEGWRRTRNGDDFRRANENDEPWIERYRGGNWMGGWSAAVEAGDVYAALRPALDDATAQAYDWFMSFFWGGRQPPREAELSGEPELFAITLGPAAVKAFEQLGDAIDLSPLREAYDELGVGLGGGWIRSFDDFEAYVGQWKALLRAASAKDAGVVVTIA